MNKKILTFILILVFLSSCSLFQKNNQEQTPTSSNTPE
jgi:PBP1b-binding outer membrane lipoprotein LpoB